MITGQKPQVTKARKSIAQFKLREGQADRRARHAARRPRLGVPRPPAVARAARASATSAACRPKQFDGNGNYTFGLPEQSVFHEIDQDKIDRVRGFDITVVTTAKNDDEGRALLRAARLPVPRPTRHLSQYRAPATIDQVGRRCNGMPKPVEIRKQAHDDDRPGRRHADPSAQRELVRTTTPSRCRTASSRPTSPRSSRRRATSPAGRSRTRASARRSRIDLKYGPNRERSIAGIKRVSKPGLRVYAKSTEIPTVLGGLGVAILSTSSGLLTDRQAEQEGRGWGSPRLRVVI